MQKTLNINRVFSDLKLRNGSSWSMFIFGALAFTLGLLGIFQPNLILLQMGLPTVAPSARLGHDFTHTFVLTSSMASLNMGVYYLFASLKNLKTFYRWTVPFRCLTFTVFTSAVLLQTAPAGLLAVSIWELTGALLTGFFLWAEDRKGIA